MVKKKDADEKMMPLNDRSVAEYLANFRERSLEDQQASIIWEELTQFPQWLGDAYKEEPAKTEALPDPRLSASQRAAAMKKRPSAPEPAAKKNGAITTKDSGKPSNPWSDVHVPETGATHVAVKTDIKPPFPGKWRKTEEGWFREA